MSALTAPEDYVFPNGAGKPHSPDDLRKRMLYPAMDAAGISRTTARAFGFHLFRHSAGSQMQQATGDLAQTQRFLGHGSIAITNDTYVHLQPDAEVKAMEKLEAAIFPKPETTEKAEKEIPSELFSIVLKKVFLAPPEQVN